MSLAKLLLDHDMPDDIGKVTSEHIRAFLLARAWADVPSVRPSASQEPPHLLPADRDRGGAAGIQPMVRVENPLGSRGGETLLHRSRDYSPAAGLHRPGAGSAGTVGP